MPLISVGLTKNNTVNWSNNFNQQNIQQEIDSLSSKVHAGECQ